jgi:hypothetical protein
VTATGSAYGAGAPSYPSVALQRAALEGRLEVAVSIRDRTTRERTRQAYARVVDELLDRLLELRGA